MPELHKLTLLYTECYTAYAMIPRSKTVKYGHFAVSFHLL